MSLELNSAAPSVQFDAPGDAVEGTVIAADTIPQTDMDTGEPLYWDVAKTKPKTMGAVTLAAPDHKDADDNGEVTVYLSGGRWSAVKAATKTVAEGAWLKLTFTGLSDQAPKVRGHSRAKRFTAEYRPPAASVDLSSGEAPAPPF